MLVFLLLQIINLYHLKLSFTYFATFIQSLPGCWSENFHCWTPLLLLASCPLIAGADVTSVILSQDSEHNHNHDNDHDRIVTSVMFGHDLTMVMDGDTVAGCRILQVMRILLMIMKRISMIITVFYV